ncbi:unnamed protein product, partial [Laminaria digitata]
MLSSLRLLGYHFVLKYKDRYHIYVNIKMVLILAYIGYQGIYARILRDTITPIRGFQCYSPASPRAAPQTLTRDHATEGRSWIRRGLKRHPQLQKMAEKRRCRDAGPMAAALFWALSQMSTCTFQRALDYNCGWRE